MRIYCCGAPPGSGPGGAITLQDAYNAAPTADPQILTNGTSTFRITMPDPASATPADFYIEINSNTAGPGGGVFISAGGTLLSSSLGGGLTLLGGDANAKSATSGFVYGSSGAGNEEDSSGSNYVLWQTGGGSSFSGDWYRTTGDCVQAGSISGSHEDTTGDADAETGLFARETGAAAAGPSGGFSDITGPGFSTGGYSRRTGIASDDTSGGFADIIGNAISDPGSYSYTGGNTYASAFSIINCNSTTIYASTYNMSIGEGVFSGHAGGLGFSNSSNVGMGLTQESGTVINLTNNTTHNGSVVGTRQGGALKLDVTTTLPVVSLLWRDNRALLGAAAEKGILQTSSTTGDIGIGSGHTIGTNTYNAHVDIFPRSAAGVIPSVMIRAGASTPGDILRLAASNGTSILASFSSVAAFSPRAGQTTAGTAPIYFTSGTNLTAPVAGAMEYSSGELFFSPSTTRFKFAFIDRAQTWTATQTLDNVTFTDAKNITFNTSTGTKIGTATNEKFAFWNATPVVQTTGSTDVLAGLVTVGLRAASSNPPLNLGTGTLTAGAGNFTGVTISTATPTLTFTDSGGDDYKIDVATGNFGITNTTDGVRGLQCSATNEWLFTNLTFGGPTTSQLVSISDRVSDAASISRAAFNATATVVTGSAWSGGNIRGFLGGATYVADQDFNNGAVLIGLEGGTTVISNTHIIQSVIGLFGTLQLSGSSTTSLGTNFGSFNTVGAGHTLTTLRHFAYANAAFSGTVTTQYGFFCPALTGAGTNLEVFMDTTARTYYRASTQYVYSSAASTLDLDTNTTLNLRVGTTIKTALTATALSQTGDFKLTTAGNGLYIKEGTNACMGVATMVAGTVVVNTTKVTANSRIFLTVQSLGTVAVATPIAVTARTAGTSFTISSSAITDTSVVAWEIKEPA